MRLMFLMTMFGAMTALAAPAFAMDCCGENCKCCGKKEAAPKAEDFRMND